MYTDFATMATYLRVVTEAFPGLRIVLFLLVVSAIGGLVFRLFMRQGGD